MKTINRIKFVLCMTSLVASCSKPVLTDNDIEIDLNTLTHETIPLSLFVDSITYLDLDSTAEAVIKIPDNIIFVDTFIVIQDGMKPSGVALFNDKGKFIQRIGHKGQGPGEYLRLGAIDATKDTIYMLDNLAKSILKYDFKGNYCDMDTLGRIGLGEDITIVKRGDSYDYLIANYNDYEKYAGIFLVDNRAGTTKRVLGCRDEITTGIGKFFNNDGQISVMTRDFENKVFKWTYDSLKLEYNLLVSPSPSKSEIANLSDYSSGEYYIRTAFHNTDQWLILNFWREDDSIRVVVINKNNRQVYIGAGLENDIDGNKFFTTPTALNGSLVRVCDAYDEKSNLRIAFQHLKK